MAELIPVIENSFTQYTGAVLQSRALIDVRDGLKPSARQIFYSMLLHKLTSANPHKKTANAVGMAMADFYIHGDSSCEGVIMRAGQNFAMRYPLVDVKGNAGSLIESGDWAAMRYTESRLSKLTDVLFADIDKNTIAEWRDNYDNTKQFPAVLPTKGFYNIVNGSMGIGVGLACSIPQFNLREMNNALIYLIDHPDCTFEEIYCAPDFATGAILYNEAEVKESLKNGTGFACKLRSVVEFDTKDRCFIVTEIPYGVYTNTICGELEAIVNGEDNPGIERFNDLTGEKPLIKIYLAKNSNPDKILKYLYKNTSLQYYYGINMTMLDEGRFPKVFTWKEALQAHIDHECEVYRRGFEYDLKKIDDRIHIIDGLLICMASIDEVVRIIKASESTAAASLALKKNFLLDDVQTKAVLDMKLSRLAHLEVKKLEKERADLLIESERIHNILNDNELFKNELKNGWRQVAQKYGDDRRTKIISLATEDDEPVEVKTLQVSLTNKNNIFVSEVSTLYTQKRGGVGNKLKMEKGEYVISSTSVENTETLLFFTSDGDYYTYKAGALTIGDKIPIVSLFPIKDWQKVCAISSANIKNKNQFIIFITKNGYIKKSDFSEYNTNRQIGIKALSLDNDEIVSVLFTENDKVGIVTKTGNFVIIKTDDIRPIGRTARGIKAIKLNDGDEVAAAHLITNSAKELISISELGLCKKTTITEFNVQGKNTKGSKIQKLTDGDFISDFAPITSEAELLVAATNSCIKLSLSDIPLLSRGTQGNKTIKLGEKEKVVGIEKF